MTTQVEYTANGATAVFPFPFAIATQADCQVLVDGVLQTGDYSVRGQGSIDGGAVAFDNPPATGKAITLRYRGNATVTARDGAPGQLADKLVAGDNVTLETVTEPDGVQRLRIAAEGGGGALTGEIRLYAGAEVPAGWLSCNGAVVGRAVYAALFEVIGTSFGAGDGSTTFALPDLRGRAPIGVGQGGGLSSRTLGQQVGAESHTLTVAELPSHHHAFDWTTDVDIGSDSPTGGVTGLPGGSIDTTSVGGGAAHPIMQPSLALTFIIKD